MLTIAMLAFLKKYICCYFMRIFIYQGVKASSFE